AARRQGQALAHVPERYAAVVEGQAQGALAAGAFDKQTVHPGPGHAVEAPVETALPRRPLEAAVVDIAQALQALRRQRGRPGQVGGAPAAFAAEAFDPGAELGLGEPAGLG